MAAEALRERRLQQQRPAHTNKSRFYLLRRIRVPQEMSVTGADNVKLWEFCYPALTTAGAYRAHHL
jgi:hypothetical protein